MGPLITSELRPADDLDGLSELDRRPAGDRYYRHPGDVVRLVVWGLIAVLLILLLQVATGTSDGLTSDLGRVARAVPRPLRELALALTDVTAAVVPLAVLIGLAVRQRWRRLGLLVLAGVGGAAIFTLLDVVADLPGRLPGTVADNTWLASGVFPSRAFVAASAAAVAIGKPWLSRQWRRTSDVALGVLLVTMAFTNRAGVPELLLALAVGLVVGAAVLVVFGAPNRRPSPAAVASALRSAGLDVSSLTLLRAVGGRAQLYATEAADGNQSFVKVYAQDSRDADLLYRGYRGAMLRGADEQAPSLSLVRDVEHEGLLLLLSHQGGVATPVLKVLAPLPDGSMALAMDKVEGRPLHSLLPGEITGELLDAVWREVVILHRSRLAHRALRAANILVADGRPVLIDLGFAEESASARAQAIDRAELLASLAGLVGSEAVVTSATRVIPAADLAAALPFLQPLALSAATRRHSSKALLRQLRADIATATGKEPVPLERLVRVRPRTVITVVMLSGAFYILLPQLAHVGDSVRAIRSANWRWLIGCVAMSMGTYVGAAISTSGGVRARLPFLANVQTQLASSFVNRVTPANVGGMALNVRFMQKAGAEPAEAVTGMGLNVLAGAIVHVVLLAVFLAWAGQGNSAFKVPSNSKVLAAIAVLLAIVGIVAATRRGRRMLKTRVIAQLEKSVSSVVALARSPLRLVALFGGSTCVTLAYTAALACAIAAFHGGLTYGQVGAVYLGSSIIAAAAPTPGGLGAMEAALVAGLTAVGMEAGIAVAAVLAYRLATYWLPILPGWLSFQLLERRNYI